MAIGLKRDYECKSTCSIERAGMGYREMESIYHRLTDFNSDVIQQMKDLIDEYVESLDEDDEVYSNRAGHSILPKCLSFGKLCGTISAAESVFGILLMKHLTKAGWRGDDGFDGRKKVKIYSR